MVAVGFFHMTGDGQTTCENRHRASCPMNRKCLSALNAILTKLTYPLKNDGVRQLG